MQVPLFGRGGLPVKFTMPSLAASGLAFLGFLIGWAPSSTQANIPASERTALDSLFSSTNGSGWTNKTGWGGAAGTECLTGWYGVSCNNTDPGVGTSHVYNLHLSANNLTGTLPDLSGLPQLHDVYFDGNLLTGGIPSLTALHSLRIFYVNNNLLTDSMPSGLLAGLTTLIYFDASNNQITGLIPTLAGLTALQIFHVDHNQLSGSIPELTTLTALSDFVVNFNQLTGPLPAPPTQLVPPSGSAVLCPNPLQTASVYETAWDSATHAMAPRHWWNPLFPGECDGVLTNGFE